MKAQDTIRQVPNCGSLEEAARRLMAELRGRKHVYCQFHRLLPHSGFPVHKHLTTNEWTVVWNAKFDFITRSGFENEVQLVDSLNEATVVYVPMGTCHTVRSRGSELRYAVIKDGPDDFHSC